MLIEKIQHTAAVFWIATFLIIWVTKDLDISGRADVVMMWCVGLPFVLSFVILFVSTLIRIWS
jgi:hypothetical protein